MPFRCKPIAWSCFTDVGLGSGHRLVHDQLFRLAMLMTCDSYDERNEHLLKTGLSILMVSMLLSIRS